SDLAARKQLAEESNADAFVSIHMNKFPQTQYKGAQVFYGNEPSEGKLLGETLQNTLKETIHDGNTRMAKKTDGSIFILKDTKIPSVIIECGFLSNPDEAKLLSQEEYQQKMAWGIYLGLVRFFNGEL
ncbi:MAG: N-acetylmuramoyl-L-alanine amidase, partial [Clostridia bacterium]|nr:N-acetylmuramoyl-L-alanine amidase [Clostridia bacterium]